MLTIKKISTFCLLNIIFQINADPVINFSFRNYPTIQQRINNKQQALQVAQKLRAPGSVDRDVILHALGSDTLTGLYGTYGGYLAITDYAGLMNFPRKHQDPFIDLIVTKNIVPVIMMGKIIHHWEIAPNTAAKMYHIERKQDAETNMFYWDCQEKEVDKDRYIPIRSVLLFAQPDNIYVPTGVTLTNDNSNLILPVMYIKNDFNSSANALFVLNIRQYFESPQHIFKDAPYGFSEQLATVG